MCGFWGLGLELRLAACMQALSTEEEAHCRLRMAVPE